MVKVKKETKKAVKTAGVKKGKNVKESKAKKPKSREKKGKTVVKVEKPVVVEKKEEVVTKESVEKKEEIVEVKAEEKGEITRCFIAIDFPDEVIKEIARVQELVGKKGFTGKFTELENLHLTLKFLGEIDGAMLEKVKEKLKEVKFGEMELKLGRIGLFGHGGKPKIVWIKIEGEMVWELQKKIDAAFAGMFKPEARFMSHLTIARIKYVMNNGKFIDHVKKNIYVKNIKFNVNSFELKKSELRPMGPVYSTIEKYVSADKSE